MHKKRAALALARGNGGKEKFTTTILHILPQVCKCGIRFAVFCLGFLAGWCLMAFIGGAGLPALLCMVAALVGGNWALGLLWAIGEMEVSAL